MKTIKLVIGIVTLSCLFFLPLIFSMFIGVNVFVSLLTFLLLLTAGLISLCARKSNHIIFDLLPAFFYFLVGAIFLYFLKYAILQCKVTIILSISVMFVLSLIFLAFTIDKLIQKKYFYKDISTEKKQNICSYCNTKTFDDICPKCGTSATLTIDNALASNGFVINKAFNGLFCSVFVDDINKKWCVFNKAEHINKGIYPYNSLIKVELYKDVSPASNLCRAMSVIVYINNLYQPTIVIDVIKQPLYTNSQQYQNSLAFAREINSTFEYMRNSTQRTKQGSL